jgi:ABC-type transport system involved in cytochrome c biogenesis permease subunit
MNGLSRYFPAGVVAAGLLYVACAAWPQQDAADQMHLHEFATLPAVHEGRVKPLDSAARNLLTIISNRQTYRDEIDADHHLGPEQPGIKWLVEAMLSPPLRGGPGDEHPVIRIENDQVLNELGLPFKPEFLRYSLREIGTDGWDKIVLASRRARAKDRDHRDLYETKMVELSDHLQMYDEVGKLQSPFPVPGLPDGTGWQPLGKALADARVFRVEDPDVRKQLHLPPRDGSVYAFADFSDWSGVLDDEARKAAKRYVDGGHDDKTLSATEKGFLDLRMAVQSYLAFEEPPVSGVLTANDPEHADALALWKILNAYKRHDVEAFNAGVASYREDLDRRMPGVMRSAAFETFFNDFAPFYTCAVLYLVVFLLTAVGWVAFTRPLHRAAFALALVTLAVHTFGLGARMYLLNRPLVFVTNLYATAVFIGWVCLIVGLILERVYRIGIGTFVASLIGFLTMLIAHGLASGDTLEMMRAVLDTNFWLATHVTTINIGYAATMSAGVLGGLYVLRGVATPALDRPTAKKMADATYAVLCFATLTSFVGTVLGGIWADQSWGRFWGWDVKEDGALMIVIWNALVLHARWGGMVKQRGVAVLALFGNCVTIWSWFGVNQLGIGLHSYGFTSGIVFWCVTAAILHLTLMLVGLIPLRFWRSYAAMQAPPPAPPPAPHAPKGRRRGERSHLVTT